MKSQISYQQIMTVISPSEYDLLKSLSGYEQQLEADKIGAKYGLSGAQIIAMISPNTNTNPQYAAHQTLRFAYDPTEDAAKRRREVTQAVSCPSCGAGLGIPSTRPIKVTCPQCLHEALFN